MKNVLLTLLFALAGLPAFAAETPARPFKVPRLFHVGYWVRDVPKSRAFYSDYLGFAEPYGLNRVDGSLQMVIMKVNERQTIYLFNDAPRILPNGDNFNHLGFETDEIHLVHDALVAKGIPVPKPKRGRLPDYIMTFRDPEGYATEFTQFTPEGKLMQNQGKYLPPTRISDRLRSATLTVSDLAATQRFYEDHFGFREVARGGSGVGTEPGKSWVKLQFPDGTDYLELLPYELKPGAVKPRAIPEYSMDVPDLAKTVATLTARAKKGGFPAPEPISKGRDGMRQTRVVDPDGTWVVFREAPAGK